MAYNISCKESRASLNKKNFHLNSSGQLYLDATGETPGKRRDTRVLLVLNELHRSIMMAPRSSNGVSSSLAVARGTCILHHTAANCGRSAAPLTCSAPSAARRGRNELSLLRGSLKLSILFFPGLNCCPGDCQRICLFHPRVQHEVSQDQISQVIQLDGFRKLGSNDISAKPTSRIWRAHGASSS